MFLGENRRASSVSMGLQRRGAFRGGTAVPGSSVSEGHQVLSVSYEACEAEELFEIDLVLL